LNTVNLTTKNIKDFLPGDSIYIRNTENPQFPVVTECKFLRWEKNRVHGQVIRVDTNPESYKHRIEEGWTISASIENCALYGWDASGKQDRFFWFNPLGVAFEEPVEDETPQLPKEHPSYGTLSISKVHGHESPCFGSPILQGNTIHITLSQASLTRSLHEDRIYPKKELFRVEMTPQQFTDMLTSPNTGSGTPVTILRVLGEQVEPTPFISKLQQFDAELKHSIKEIHHEAKTGLAQIVELIGKSKLPQKEKTHITRLVESLNQSIESNLPFLSTIMAEEMDRVVGEAKTVIHAYLNTQAAARNIQIDGATPFLSLENTPKP